MTGKTRPRWLLKSAVTASLALALAACGPEYPNTTFAPLSELTQQIDHLWDILLTLGLIVFVLVEIGLLYIIFRFRHRDSAPEPKHIHGHTTLEIAWTMIPALILLVIAVPTVRTIFMTQAEPPSDGMVVEVRGHQWWWEFEYPEYGFKTANELYIPAGRPIVLNISTDNVLHSFWIPRLAGKRDAINKRVNHIWFTANQEAANQVFNGFCAEYCGDSHGNMQFRVFVLNNEDFERWTAHQKTTAMVEMPGAAATPAAGATTPAAGAAPAQGGAATAVASAQTTAAATAPVVQAAFEFPRDRIPDYAIPKKPYPEDIQFDENLVGDPARGAQLFMTGQGGCVGCHAIAGTPFAAIVGPNLTHVATRTTIAGALYPNTREYLLRWIKNAPGMKPGSKMPSIGKGIVYKPTGAVGTLEDQQIADIVAWLMSLK